MNMCGLIRGAAVVPAIFGMIFLGGCKPGGGSGADADGGSEGSGQVQVVDGGEGTGGEGAPAKAAVPALPKWTPEDAGFARHLPADTDLYMSVRQLDVFWDLFEDFSSDEALERLDMEKLADATGEDIEDVEEWSDLAKEEVSKVFPQVFGEDVFLCARGLDWWLKPYVFYQKELYPAVMAEMIQNIGSGNFGEDSSEEQLKDMMGQFMGFMRTELFSQDQVPTLALQMGGRVTGDRTEVLDAMSEWLAKVPGQEAQFADCAFERNGVQWRGFRVDWEKLLEEGKTEDLEQAQEWLGENAWEELVRFQAKIPLIVVCGEVGDYVVLSIGLGEDSVEFCEEPGESLAGKKTFGMLAEHEESSVFGTLWMDEGLISRTRILLDYGPMWKGLADGLEGVEKLTTGPEMARSLREIGKLGEEKRAGVAHDLLGAVVLKNGLHLELKGGWAGVSMDLEAPLELAGAVSQWEDQPFLRAHWRKNAEYTEKTLRQWEEGMKLADLIQQEVSAAVESAFERLDDLEEELGEDLDGDDEGDGPDRRRELAELMKRDFKQAMENLWRGYREHLRHALGEEAALVMDLQGEAPPIVGFDEETLERGRIPRLAYVRSVENREELAVTWELWRDAGVRLLGLMAEATDTPIPFPDTMSANTNDLRTHFMPMPFATDDFLPNISVSDDLFIVGSSKALAARISESLKKVEGSQPGKSGVLMEIHMDPWWDFCEAWLDVAAAQQQSQMPEEPGDDGDRDDPEGPDVELEEDEAPIPLEEGLEELDPELEALIEEVEGDGFIAEDGVGFWEGLKDAMPFELDEGADPEAAVRGWIGHARKFRGASYRKWLDDGVPRSRMSFHWGEAPTVEE